MDAGLIIYFPRDPGHIIFIKLLLRCLTAKIFILKKLITPRINQHLLLKIHKRYSTLAKIRTSNWFKGTFYSTVVSEQVRSIYMQEVRGLQNWFLGCFLLSNICQKLDAKSRRKPKSIFYEITCEIIS